MNSVSEVQAAGGVILRESGKNLELLLIHRPKYDDWSFPKGKLDGGESFEEAATREVLEETAVSCRLDAPLSTVRYLDSKGRLKEVRYWLMSAVAGDVTGRDPDHEVDQVRWISLPAAGELLTYERDRQLLEEALELFDTRK